MAEVRFRSDMSVDLINSTPNPDEMVVAAARVSTLGAASATQTDGGEGLIKFLMRNRHGSAFEHNQLTYLISAPIFVWREMMRHRIASWNEESARYRQLDPVFYMPASDRSLVQIGKPGKYEYVAGDPDQVVLTQDTVMQVSTAAYQAYEKMLEEGIAREVARMVLPVNIYSSAYVTMNARALMNFLSLRTKHPGSAYPSFPMREINTVADQMEVIWREHMPITAKAFDDFGRVSP